MYLPADTLDDLLHEVFEILLKSKNHIRPSKPPAREEIGVILGLTNPRARLSRTETKGKAFSCLGELLWYLAGANDLDFIHNYIRIYEDYSDDGKTLYGAYGPRLFNMRGEIKQWDNVLKILKTKKDSRQAIIQLFDARDLVEKHKDVPCT